MSAAPTKTYLVRAIYDWCNDSGFTPYVAVLVDARTLVPPQHVNDGQIVLNIAPYATNKLIIDEEALSCQARFSGKVENLYVPLSQILAIYARENGQGMAFQPGILAGSAMELGGMADATPVEAPASVSPSAAAGEAPETAAADASGDDSPEPPPSPRGGHLRRIK